MTLTQRCIDKDPISLVVPLGVHLIHISYDCILSAEDWTLIGHLEKEGRITVSELQVLPVSPVRLTQEIPEEVAKKLIEEVKWQSLDPVVSQPLGQIALKRVAEPFDWAGHGGHISWGLIIFLVALVAGIIVLIVVYRNKWKQTRLGKALLQLVPGKDLPLEAPPSTSGPTSQVFVFEAPGGGVVPVPTPRRLSSTLECIPEETNDLE